MLDKIYAHVKEEHGFTVDNSKTVFYGICRDCQKELEDKDR